MWILHGSRPGKMVNFADMKTTTQIYVLIKNVKKSWSVRVAKVLPFLFHGKNIKHAKVRGYVS